jgi:hypothetical protein
MNERIALLALKASDPKTGWLDRQKFAELIVRECANLFEIEYGTSEVSGNEVARVLQRHFGVEE